MPTYQIHYTTVSCTAESELTLVTDAPATEIQIVEAAAKDSAPVEEQEIGDVAEIAADAEAEIEDQCTVDRGHYHDLMAEWDIVTLRYTADDGTTEVHL